MICHEFKCGIGTASRVVETADGRFTVGVLVQANYGLRRTLLVAGVPVGHYLTDDLLYSAVEDADETGSIIIVVATDAPLLPQQLKRIARRAALGLARVGGTAGNGSGDIFIAFSTGNEDARQFGARQSLEKLTNARLSPLFNATVFATEEAIINALVAGRDMIGHRGFAVSGVDHEALRDVLRRHNRLIE